jgi:hypothetical protein
MAPFTYLTFYIVLPLNTTTYNLRGFIPLYIRKIIQDYISPLTQPFYDVLVTTVTIPVNELVLHVGNS